MREIEHIDSVILDGTIMPSVIIAVGFLSNPKEEKKLMESSYCQRIAEIIYKGILKYKKEIGRNIE